MNEPLYKLENLSKSFTSGPETITVLDRVDLCIEKKETVAVQGASGCGKSTLLHILGTLDDPTEGKVFFNGQDLSTLTPVQKAALRRTEMGFIFQFHHLLPEFNTLENVAMPAVINGINRKKAHEAALEALDQVGLKHKAGQSVTTLSGGESQRAAIARAILPRPGVLLADEPTGNLDEAKGREVGDLLLHLNRELGMTLVVVTHNLDLASRMNINYELKSGGMYVLNQ
ncbi:ABC transporter related protein [Desulfonatronospira thiodismutans ASO3-1]|uniref:ABC transporter related protein n=1 Tax=Desulfonatronospira thiodismutans ASO3-1 TaxID=555779 RepID=D6SPA7_9BACT|nr:MULTISPECIES: ABC transporter ATP-binding protein [Desulfonatronospira]EFI34583.1 ABC transporter related protein [Desulfonatronospira thiodismutans ASO3-1]RQD76417.1 MAG: ABC transporter ATP-binding protein [Desulfonatronospira sp. MSAO_Bac3]